MEEKENQEYNLNLHEFGTANGHIEYYKKIEKTISSSTSNINNIRPREFSSFTNKTYSIGNEYEKENENEYERGNSFSSNQRGLLPNRNRSFSSKEKYTYSGRVKEKNNYVYYVSGVGYVNKKGEKKPDNKIKTEIKVIKNKPPLPISRPRRERIIINSKKEQSGTRGLIDNYNYHETKDIKKEKKRSIVSHQRLSEPIMSTINISKKRYSSYTQQPKVYSFSSSSLQNDDFELVEPKATLENAYNIINSNTHNISIVDNNKNSYFTSKTGSHSLKYYNINSLEKYSNYGNKTSTYLRRDFSERRKSYISIENNNQYKSSFESKYTERNKTDFSSNDNTNYITNYNNIKKYEIKDSSVDKIIKDNNINTNLNINVNFNERRQYIQPKREHKIVERNKTNTINSLNTNNALTTNVDDIIKEIRKKYGLDELTQSIGNDDEKREEEVEEKVEEKYEEKFEEKYEKQREKKVEEQIEEKKEEKKNYYYPSLHSEISLQSNYISKKEKANQNVPDHVEQITVYEKEKEEEKEKEINNKYNIIPQQIHEIEINEKITYQNIPQRVQQIQIHEDNREKNIPHQNNHIQKEEVYKVNNENFEQEKVPQQNIEIVQTDEENQANMESSSKHLEQNEEIYQKKQENMEEMDEENVEGEQNKEEYQENDENIQNQENQENKYNQEIRENQEYQEN